MKPLLRITLPIAATIGATSLLLAIVVFPSSARITTLSTAIKEEYARIAQITSRTPNLRQTTAALHAIQQDLPSFEAMLVEQGKEIELFKLIEAKIRLFELTAKLRLGDTQPALNGMISKFTVDVELEGPFPNILQFVDGLEYADHLFPLQRLDMRSSPPTSVTGSAIVASIKGSMYVYNQP